MSFDNYKVFEKATLDALMCRASRDAKSCVLGIFDIRDRQITENDAKF